MNAPPAATVPPPTKGTQGPPWRSIPAGGVCREHQQRAYRLPLDKYRCCVGGISVAAQRDIEVMVVGSGGRSTAYELVQRGKKVVVLDRCPIGTGRSSRPTAHSVAISDDSFDSFIGGPPRAPACSGTHLKCVGISRITDHILRLTERRSTLTPWQPLRPLQLQRQRSTQKHASAFETNLRRSCSLNASSKSPSTKAAF
jgi:hypothetical protein